MKDDDSHHLNQFKSENDDIPMGDEKVRQTLKDDPSHHINQFKKHLSGRPIG